MIIRIDYREKQLIECCNTILSKNDKLSSNIKLETSNLDVGDISICDDTNNEILLIERKSINDLASSIVDKRYSEQSYRLFHTPIPNHNIIYLIEGRISELNTRYTRITEPAIYSAMIVLSYHKGFSVFRTFNVQESAQYILRISDKIQREKKQGYYSIDSSKNQIKEINNEIHTNVSVTDNSNNVSELVEKHSYCVKRKRAGNITPDNIGEIILSQIPGVSEKTAHAIMLQFSSISDFIIKLKEDRTCLDLIKMETSNGSRKISSSAKNNIINYILNIDNVIKIQ
jgi:ERCC4-type nuclease